MLPTYGRSRVASILALAALGAGFPIADAAPAGEAPPAQYQRTVSAPKARHPSPVTSPVIRYAPPTARMMEEAARRAGGGPPRRRLTGARRLYNRRVVQTFGDGSIHRMKYPFA